MVDKEDKQLGFMAVQSGIISAKDLKKALAEYDEARGDGTNLTFGEFLVQHQYLGQNSLMRLLNRHRAGS